MTAGRGITHSERFETLRAHRRRRCTASRPGSPCPTETEETDPAFAHHGADDLPTYEGGGLWARLIAGEAFGAKAKVKTHSPMFYVHWRLDAGAKAQLPAEYPERAAFVAAGVGRGRRPRPSHAGQMIVFAAGAAGAVHGGHRRRWSCCWAASRSGQRFIEWNFVSSSKERIEQAKADWRAGRMKLPDLDHDEFIPLPPDPTPPPSPLS